MRRRSRFVGVLVLALVATVTWWLAPRAPDAPGILLVTIDTLRADRVGAYGAADVRTPALDSLAAEGVLFEAAYATAPLTLPSHVSMLSGLLPVAHSVRTNDGYQVPDGVALVAPALQRAGMMTGAFIASAVLRRGTGLAEGFDHYDDEVGAGGERVGGVVVERARQWLEGVGNRPFFAWVHLYDPHLPYAPPAPFDREYAGRPYDGEVAYADASVKGLLDALTSFGLARRTTLIAVADHGEGLGAHGERSHGTLLYETTVRVPLVIRLSEALTRAGRGRRAPGTRIATPVSTADVAPTIRVLAGLEPGRSSPTLLDVAAADDGAEPVTAETLYLRQQLGWSPLYAARVGPYKLIEAPTPEVYDLKADAAEARNLAATDPALVERLRARLQRELTSAAREARSPATRPVDPDAAGRLAALGYVGGSGHVSVGVEPVGGANPLDRVSDWDETERALEAAQRGDLADATARFKALLDRDAGHVLALKFLGAAALARNALDEAVRFNEKVVAAGLHVADAASNLGLARHRLGQSQAAITALERALSEQPAHAQARANLAVVLREAASAEAQLGRWEAAAVLYQRAIEHDPRDLEAAERLGAVLHRAGRRDEARARFEAVLAEEPSRSGPRLGLAMIDLEEHRPSQAIARLEPLVARHDAAHRVQFLLGDAYSALGDDDRARQAYEACLRLAPAADPIGSEARRRLARYQ